MLCDPKISTSSTIVPAGIAVITRLILPPASWPVRDMALWMAALAGHGPEDDDNPATEWRPATIKKVADGYGRYLSWLMRNNELAADETPRQRITPERVKPYVASLKEHLAPVSVGMTLGALVQAANAFAPIHDWGWLSLRYSRLKIRAKPSRDKQSAIRPTLEIYEFGISIMRHAQDADVPSATKAIRFQSGLMIALLAARPLRIRNFQAITIGESLRYDKGQYRLTFTTEETKTRRSIDEPIPNDLIPYLERYLWVHRVQLLRGKGKHGDALAHRRLWIDRQGDQMEEFTLRSRIEAYTKAHFGVSIWPHLFRDCLFTTIAVEQPEMIKQGSILLGHTSFATGEKYYNQAGMMEASRRYTASILELRTSFIADLLTEQSDKKQKSVG